MHIINREAKISVVGFYNLPKLAKKFKIKLGKKEIIIDKIKRKGYKVAETHFASNSIRSDISEKELLGVLK